MYDKELVANSIRQIRTIVNTILERTQMVKDVNGFLLSPQGMVILDAVCMNLIALGEAVKNLDKLSCGKLLPQYDAIEWHSIMRMRDKIAHHYFEIDAEMVFLTIKEDIPRIKSVIDQMSNSFNET